jgi:hypothetical protein
MRTHPPDTHPDPMPNTRATGSSEPPYNELACAGRLTPSNQRGGLSHAERLPGHAERLPGLAERLPGLAGDIFLGGPCAGRLHQPTIARGRSR